MNVRILRGARQIGGTSVELEHDGERIVLDAGMPMGPLPEARALLPDVPGLWGPGDGTLLAVFISHAHPDHVGLADLVDPGVPVFIGARAAAMIRETRFFVPCALDLAAPRVLADGVPVTLGPFTVTPIAVDHGIDDAFALLVEADGRRLLYSGDLRGHGRDVWCLDRLAQRAGPVDVLLLEGTRIGRGGPEEPEFTEADVEQACANRFAAAEGAVVVLSSGHNLDRIESIIRAASSAGRQAVLDLYVATLWTATGRPWPSDARVRLTRSQRLRVMMSRDFARTRAVRHVRIYDDELAQRASELVIVPRTSALEELEDLGVLLDADAVWSMWPGYMEFESMRSTMRLLRRNGVAIHVAHASGHACARDLQKLATTLAPARIVPIHTERPDALAELVGGAERYNDGEWWRA